MLTKPRQNQSQVEKDQLERDPFVDWEIVDVQFPDDPDTDYVIRHSLGPDRPRDVHYRVIKQFTPGTVYESNAVGRKEWSNDFIVLRSDEGGWTGRLLLGLLNDPDRFEQEEFVIPSTVPVVGPSGTVTHTGTLTANRIIKGLSL